MDAIKKVTIEDIKSMKFSIDFERHNTINYAEKWDNMPLEIYTQGMLTAAFMTSNVRWLNAQTFNFTQMSVGGFGAHNRAGGWNRKTIAQTNVPYTVQHDRDAEFLVDKADVDESNQTAAAQNVTDTFTRTQAAPEADAYFHSTVATTAIALGASNSSQTATASYTKTNIYGLLKGYLASSKIRRYIAMGGVIMFIRSELMDLLEQSEDFVRKIEMTAVGPNGTGLMTRVTSIDGVTLVEVIDDERFYTAFDFTDAFVPEVGAFKINVLIAALQTVITVPKISSIYFFAPGTHTQGDGYLYQRRDLWDTFVLPNGKDNVVDSIYCDYDTVAVV